MAKAKKSAKSAGSKIKDELKLLALEFLDKQSVHLVDWIKNISNIKSKIQNAVLMHALLISALILILIGVVQYIDSLVNLPAGVVSIIAGVVILILMWISCKLR